MAPAAHEWVDSQGTQSILELLVRLVNTPSYPGIPRQEEGVVREITRYLESLHIENVVTEVVDGRPNLLASVMGGRPGPHLLFCGHTDTVPPNIGDPFYPQPVRQKEGRLHGRGSADMKGALAAMAGALAALKVSGELVAGRVTFAAVIDEENQSLGVEDLIRSGFRADAAIVGEPTENTVAIGHKGLEWLHVEVKGRAAHGGTPQAGVSAILGAAHFIQLIEQELIPLFGERHDPVLGSPAINVGTIAGGDQPSTVASHCVIKLDRRWVSTETIEQVFDDLVLLAAAVEKARPGIRIEVSRAPEGMATMLHGPLVIRPDHPVVAAAQRSLSRFLQRAVPLTVFPAWTDGALLSREGHIPTIIWGPGQLEYAHSPEESILLEEVISAAKFYAQAALFFTGSQ